jgi:uncharacterized protein (TIGR02594 family)
MPRSLVAGAVALVLILATGSALARISGPLGFDLVALARSQIGNGAIYGRHTRWCARFVNWVLEHAGYRGTGSDAARSFLRLPHTSPEIGAIAILSRKGGGHVGIVSGFDTRGNPVLISGNHGHRVYESTYPRSRVLAYVMPAAQEPAGLRLADGMHHRIAELSPTRRKQPSKRDGGDSEIAPDVVMQSGARFDPRQPVFDPRQSVFDPGQVLGSEVDLPR